jgi:glyoxylate reductase
VGSVVVSSAALPFDVAPLLGDASLRAPAAGHLDRAALLRQVADADALIALLSDRVDDELLAAAPRLRVVANFAVGFDNVDRDAATRRGVVCTNTPDVLTEATADFAFALLLAAARRVVEGDRLVRDGAWTGWAPGHHLGADVGGRVLGIVGLGRIGAAVATRARGFSMPILYCGPREVADADALGARRVPRQALLAESDFVSLHCPLTDDTRHVIDADALAAMKPTAILVNTARGGCVDEPALARALAAGQIAGAGLDVFAAEPAVDPELLAGDRVVLAPHAGSATTTARKAMAQICANSVRAVLDGRRPDAVINPEVYA